MFNKAFFPELSKKIPKVYVYSDKNYPGMLKVGFTNGDVDNRIRQQYPTLKPDGLPYKKEFETVAMRNDGTSFTDKDVHKRLVKKGFKRLGGEWFDCKLDNVRNAILELKEGKSFQIDRVNDFGMREEQLLAVERTSTYFMKCDKEEPNKPSHFLWNAKMRFGKTFTSYQLAKKMGWKRILILTFKPAVESGWDEDLNNHIDFEGWQFVSRHTENTYKTLDKDRPIVCFGSFQDYLGKNSAGGMMPKDKNLWVHKITWDCIILDEYHYGAWRDKAKNLTKRDSTEEDKDYLEELAEEEGTAEKKFVMGEGQDYFDEKAMPIKTNHFLYLSGTPFRAIADGEFLEEQIFNWTYTDEQEKKTKWDYSKGSNPYESLPRIVMLTYKMPSSITNIIDEGEFNEFDLGEFFKAEGTDEKAKFKHEDSVQKWLDMIRGAYISSDSIKANSARVYLPFRMDEAQLQEKLLHTLWLLPNIASCCAMKNLLAKKNNSFYHDYKIVLAAGKHCGNGVEALNPLYEAMDTPQKSKTITLSCGKLTTGVTVRPWTGIFMLRNLNSPETYFQAAFRVQSPWTYKDEDSNEEIIKKECYIFDFAPNRALRQISDYCIGLNYEENNPEAKTREFIQYLPILAYDGFTMEQLNATKLFDMAITGTTATLLANGWKSARMVNVNDYVIQRILDDPKAIEILQKIEDFRTIKSDLELIINKSDRVRELKTKASDKDLTPKEKKELSDEQKEYKSKRKEFQEKLMKLATRIPIFMYLTDYREQTMIDVIERLDTGLFTSVTGLTQPEFSHLNSLGVFCGDKMNQCVWGFRQYENASLEYTGINKHDNDSEIGGWDTTDRRNTVLKMKN